ncbi:Zinc carboxypeptidase [Granulicella rosea]|uniref:Zinc carboxypeptidase n=1 Tax=Granulicella rosea TaxID=474952 RepID=A0A239LZZ4_9BACT|nr:M14 family metallopeptidase [Granulicella rosea]SNT36177.1 Zinc carboxypeptidase [Granulicella rosea]
MTLLNAVRLSLACCTLSGIVASAQTRTITTPKESIGFNMGDDYMMANYTQAEAYVKKLATESDRMKLVDMGLTAEGRHQWMAIISSPENLAKLDHYKEIAKKLSHAEGLTDAEAHALAEEGRAIVWIDGGLHASETVGSQQLVETIYELNSLTDPETLRFLKDDIALCVFANPDGMELVANWYMREPDPKKRVMDGPGQGTPRLWQKYVGHDNNRDFYMNNQNESINMSRALFREYYPQIMYNHHQTGPAGTVIFMPPFRDPFNFHYDPLIPLKIEAVGTAMHERLVEEGKPGSGMRSTAPYSTWYNGGLRTVTYFHNMTGILTEIIGSPTPSPLPLIAARQLPTGDEPFPVAPQMWHYKQSIDYEQTNNRAILDYASREREHLLYDTYLMGKNSIQRGSEDSWTITPKRIDALEEAAAKAAEGKETRGARAAGLPAELYKTVLHDPEHRDPRGYVLPSDQPDFPTAVKFVNALMKSGVTIERATAAFEAEGKHYPAGSLFISCAQAYRPQILDMMEPQDHPNDFAYPGAPPTKPYDATGWTLAYQMGVTFDRMYTTVKGPFEPIATDLAAPPAGTVSGGKKVAGYVVSHEFNDAYTLTNRLLKAKLPVYWLKQPLKVDGQSLAAGALWVPYSATAQGLIESAAKELGVTAHGVAAVPAGEALLLHPERIGLYDQYGGSMPSGWTRWLLEQFEFPFTVVYPQTLDAGDLHVKFDDLIFADGTFPNLAADAPRMGAQPKPEAIPAEFRPWLGRITAEKTVPQIAKFVADGGTVLAIGSSTRIYKALHLPVRDGLTEVVKGKEQPVPSEKFYIPGSLLQVQLDNTQPVAYGMPSSVDVFYDNSPSFKALPDAAAHGLQTVAWYGQGNLLDSGWAWGQAYLNDTIAVAQANAGKGKVMLFGPEIAFRGQPHATFKFLFNGILYGAATPATLR